MGVSTGEAEVYHDREMAINPGQVFGALQGIEGKDPAFGLEATWISKEQVEQAVLILKKIFVEEGIIK